MDQIAAHTTTVKVHQAKFDHVNKEIKDLQSERVVVKSCVGDVNAFLSNILDSHDPILTISIHKHLVEKFHPTISKLSRIEVVSETPIILKQGGEAQSKKGEPKPSAKHTVKSVYEPKGKEKLFSDEPIIDNSEDEEPDKTDSKREKLVKLNWMSTIE